MDVDADFRAYDALSQHPHSAELARTARAVMTRVAADRGVDGRALRVAELAAQHGLTREQAQTPFGNALDVLERGPEDDAERSLARALAARAIALQPPNAREEEDQAAADILCLATRTPFDATGLLDQALGPQAATMWDAIAEQIRRFDQGARPALGRGEALVAAAALVSSTSTAASKLVAALAIDVRDRQLCHVLESGAGVEPADRARGEWAAPPRGSLVTALLALSGIALLVHGVRFAARTALAYKRPVEVSVTADGALRIRWHTEILGRILQDQDVVVPRSGLARATRDVRYPSLALYAGLLALALGSYVGMSAFVDGVRAKSPSLLLTGIAIITVGIAVDFVLSTIAPGRSGRCRVLFVPRRGPAICVGSVDIEIADGLLARLARR